MKAEYKILAIFGLSVFLLLALGSIEAWNTARSGVAVDRVAHTYQVIGRLDSAMVGILDVESGARGYAASGDDVFLQQYQSGIRMSRRALDDVRRLTADNRSQQSRLPGVEVTLSGLVREGDFIVGLRRAGKRQDALDAVTDARSTYSTELAKQIQVMKSEELSLLHNRSVRAENQTITTQMLAIAAIAVAVILVSLAAFSVRRDFRMRQIAEEEQERFFDLSLDMLCISSADGFFKRLSPAFTRTLGWSIEELLKTPFLDLVHPEDREATLAEVDRQVQAGESVMEFENRYRHQDGSYRILSWKSMPGPGQTMYATARDVTERKHTEARLSELNERLQSRNQELEAAHREADRANQAKSDFLSNMSHELRTPLNAVIGHAQLLQMRSQEPLALDSASAILKGGRHLLDLINEVLDLSRIEAGKMSISQEAVPMRLVIRQAMDIVQPIARDRQVTISVEGDLCEQVHVKGDRQRLVQVLLNLLTNGSKYNRSGGEVIISCTLQQDDRVRVEIRDTGIGIGEDLAQRLFTPFERGSHADEGTGLGLALSQRLMKLMDGNLWLVRSDSGGTVFALDLPASDPPQTNGGDSVKLHRLLPSPDTLVRIVYIEDNLSNLQLMEKVLDGLPGYRLLPAMQASIGIQLVREHQPDLVLLDLHLPDAAGFDVLRILKSDSQTSQIPVVVLSADATDNQIKRLLAAGARSYLTKPIDLDLLFAELADVKKNSQRLDDQSESE